MRFILTLIPLISIFSSVQALPFSTNGQTIDPTNSEKRDMPGSNFFGTKIGVSWPVINRKLAPDNKNSELNPVHPRADENKAPMDFKALTNGFKGAARIESLPEQN